MLLKLRLDMETSDRLCAAALRDLRPSIWRRWRYYVWGWGCPSRFLLRMSVRSPRERLWGCETWTEVDGQ